MDQAIRPPAPVRRLWTGVLLGYLALGATLQELPGYLVTHFQASIWTATVVVGIAFAATAIARPFAGRGGDAGHGRSVVLIGALLVTVGAGGHLLAPDIVALIGARLVMGAGEAALFSAALPWVLTSTAIERRGTVTGWFGLSMWTGLAVGPLLAVAASALGGSVAAWCLVMVLPVLSVAVVATTRPPLPAADHPPLRPGSWRDIMPAGVGLPGLYLGLGAYGYGTISTVLVLYLGAAKIGGQSYGLAAFAVGFLIARFLGSPLIDRIGPRAAGRLCVATAAIGLIALVVATTAAGALSATALIGIGLSLVYPSATGMALVRASPTTIGATAAAATSFWDLGVLAAGLISGAVVDSFGYRDTFLVAAAASVLAIAVTFAIRPHAHASTTPPSAPERREQVAGR